MKVRVTNTTFSTPKGESINGKIFDAEKEGRLYTISARDLHRINPDAFDPNYGKYHFCPNEIEELPKSTREMFKRGDKVRFKKEFYKEEYFKGLTREKRKRAADIASLGEFDVFCEDRRRVHVTDKFKVRHNIDASLLELCKEPAKVKVGDKIRITRYQRGDEVGTVSEVIRINLDRVDYKSLKSSDGIFSASSDACELVTEPEVKEVKRKAEVGDFIKITYYSGGDKIGTVAEVIGVRKTYVKYKSNKSCRGYYYAMHYGYEIVESPKRKWTEEEIVKAKCFLAEELVNGKCKFTFDINNNETTCYNFESNKIKSAKCAYNDECNRYIGAVVAYCRTSGAKIPKFIKR